MSLSDCVRAVLLTLTLSVFVGDGPSPQAPGATEIVVRPTEIDVKGHVNNAKYIEYLQWNRWDWLDKKGLTNERLSELQTVLVVANININYRKEVKQGENLRVSVTVEKVGEKSVTLKQIVVKADGEVAADALVVLVAIDPTIRKSRPLPAELRKELTP